jgi:hypothetical protein
MTDSYKTNYYYGMSPTSEVLLVYRVGHRRTRDRQSSRFLSRDISIPSFFLTVSLVPKYYYSFGIQVRETLLIFVTFQKPIRLFYI